jgi:hypothetical protein
MFASFYTYGTDGEQVWLTAQMSSQDGTTANVNVFMPTGGQWGDAFDPADVTATAWGTGTFTYVPDLQRWQLQCHAEPGNDRHGLHQSGL